MALFPIVIMNNKLTEACRKFTIEVLYFSLVRISFTASTILILFLVVLYRSYGSYIDTINARLILDRFPL